MTNGNGQSGKAPLAIILAAGKGTRMESDLPKVVHPIGGRPMVCAVVDACRAAGCERIVLVVGYKQEVVRDLMAKQGAAWSNGIEYAVQEQQLGTGHAVLSAKATLGATVNEHGRPCFVLAGDGPLIRAETLRTMLKAHTDSHAAATLATSVIDDPTGYGRIVRDSHRKLSAIVEHKECTPDQLKIREVNPSYYCFDTAKLFTALAQVKRNEQSGEYYITDVPALLLKQGERVEVIEAVPPQDILSIDTPAQLAEVDAIYPIAPDDVFCKPSRAWSHPLNNDLSQLKVFAGRTSHYLADRICSHIERDLGRQQDKQASFKVGHTRIETFPDGEVIVKLEEDVRGRDVFVVLSTCAPVNDNIMELLIFVDCLRRASAKRITAVMPYFGYARQDRKDEGRVPITAKLVANLLTAARIDRVLALDLHAAQIQGFFDIPVDHLSATPVFHKHFAAKRAELTDLCLVSPDVGNVKVAESFANLLGGELAIINKRRKSGSEVETSHIIGNVKGKTVLMFDDMIATGGTVVQAAELVMQQGAKRVIAAATHGVMAGKAIEKLMSPAVSEIVVTNTVPLGPRVDPIRHKLTELCVGDLLGEAIHRIHCNLSISALFRGTAGVKR